ncbi:PREDICTED: heparanase-like protein 3 [Erythranthe guttata]|uniref:heparanase-like protein 3 n=1 Tax=Erythranthe guttata TaxID=4155 RepID=UPI00064DBB8A|nr:PREDICTED: heparanase-like protein 3 [Erythranthe guttata]|eukprot:XP_012836330.1 PREDICTED: heparanase-like protein 3 [Erythranthe guttata]
MSSLIFRAIFTFGINALNGKTIEEGSTGFGPANDTLVAKGRWDYSNVESFIRYTVEKGYNVFAWDLAVVAVDISAAISVSVINLYDFVEAVWNIGNELGGIAIYLFVDAEQYARDAKLLKETGTSAVGWVSESGGAYNSGRDGVTNTFVFSFWYLDILGMAETYDTKVFCRQTLVGGYYSLLDTTTFLPNPDYYRFEGSGKIRAYAHCAKNPHGVVVLLINLDGNTTAEVKLSLSENDDGERLFDFRQEYHLTPLEGNIQSKTVLLNGKPLIVDIFIWRYTYHGTR